MKTNAYFNDLRDNALAGKLMTLMTDMVKDYAFALPHGWRFIAKIITTTDKGTPPQQLFYLDIQADEGGGSWAEAKIQTMDMLNLAASQPLSAGRIRNQIRNLGMQDTTCGKEICCTCNEIYAAKNYKSKGESSDILTTDRLTPEAIKWLVDVKDGPGIAPNFGGLKLQTRCHFFRPSSEVIPMEPNQPIAETDTIYVSFSGAKAWQDLSFATCALRHIVKHFRGLDDECFEFDFEPLQEIPEVNFWLQAYGLN